MDYLYNVIVIDSNSIIDLTVKITRNTVTYQYLNQLTSIKFINLFTM